MSMIMVHHPHRRLAIVKYNTNEGVEKRDHAKCDAGNDDGDEAQNKKYKKVSSASDCDAVPSVLSFKF